MPPQLLRHQSPRQPPRLPPLRRDRNETERPQIFGFESSVCSVSDDSAPMPKRHKSTNPVIKTVIQEEALQPPAPDTSFELPVVSPPAHPMNW